MDMQLTKRDLIHFANGVNFYNARTLTAKEQFAKQLRVLISRAPKIRFWN